MRIHIAHSDDNRLGGGWSWISNASKALAPVLASYEDADTYLIPSPSICTKEEVDQAQADGKKIVLRCDNIVRNSRNRNTGMSRMKRFADMADVVIYQSQFARDLLIPYLGIDGPVILNSCDTDIFHDRGRTEDATARYIYSRVNRDETKNWEMARYSFQQESLRRSGDAKLHIVGEFSPELQEYNFDFYMNEDYRYHGVISDPNYMAGLYRDSDYLIYTFWNDACSNTLIEALCSGCYISDPYGMVNTGGAGEIVEAFKQYGTEYFSLARMGEDYMGAIHG